MANPAAVAASSSTRTAATCVLPRLRSASSVPLPAMTTRPARRTTIGLRWPYTAREPRIASRLASECRRALAGSRTRPAQGTASGRSALTMCERSGLAAALAGMFPPRKTFGKFSFSSGKVSMSHPAFVPLLRSGPRRPARPAIHLAGTAGRLPQPEDEPPPGLPARTDESGPCQPGEERTTAGMKALHPHQSIERLPRQRPPVAQEIQDLDLAAAQEEARLAVGRGQQMPPARRRLKAPAPIGELGLGGGRSLVPRSELLPAPVMADLSRGPGRRRRRSRRGGRRQVLRPLDRPAAPRQDAQGGGGQGREQLGDPAVGETQRPEPAQGDEDEGGGAGSMVGRGAAGGSSFGHGAVSLRVGGSGGRSLDVLQYDPRPPVGKRAALILDRSQLAPAARIVDELAARRQAIEEALEQIVVVAFAGAGFEDDPQADPPLARRAGDAQRPNREGDDRRVGFLELLDDGPVPMEESAEEDRPPIRDEHLIAPRRRRAHRASSCSCSHSPHPSAAEVSGQYRQTRSAWASSR